VNIVVFKKTVGSEGPAVVLRIDAGFVEFEGLATLGAVPAMIWPLEVLTAEDRPIEFGVSEPLLEKLFPLVEAAEVVVFDCWVEPLLLLFASAVPLDTVVDAVNTTTPGLKPAREPFAKVPFRESTLTAVVLFEICLLSTPVPGVGISIEMASGPITESDSASFRRRVSSCALTDVFVVVTCVLVMMVASTSAAIRDVKRQTQIILKM
jgi:hypothetical protein